MSSMMQPVSGLISSAAQASRSISAVKEAPEVQRPENEAPVRSRMPAMDEYVPEEKREPSGQYWLGRDENGRPKVYFDDPERAADESGKPDDPAKAQGSGEKAGGSGAESCTGSTDQVDREIERLKKKKEELEQQINAQTDGDKIKELERKLTQVEHELRQKDNDTYRRQHTVFF